MGKKATRLAFAKTIGLIVIMFYVITWVLLLFISRVMGSTGSLGREIGIISLVALPISIVAAIITFNIMMAHERKNPLSILEVSAKKEMRENGFSDRFFQLTTEGINLYRREPSDSAIGYFLQLVVGGAIGYIYREDYQKALELINLIDNKALRSETVSFLDGGYSLILYFDTQINVCYRLQDRARVERVMEDAKPYLERFRGKNEMINLCIEETYYYYYLTLQDVDSAKKYAEAMLSNPLNVKERFPDGYMAMARICRLSGDLNKETEYINEAKQIVDEKKIPLFQQSFDFYMRERTKA